MKTPIAPAFAFMPLPSFAQVLENCADQVDNNMNYLTDRADPAVPGEADAKPMILLE